MRQTHERGRILAIGGTRPEAIKLAPLVLELRRRDVFDVKLCSTGQHRELLTQALDLFSLKADFDLGLMTENQSLARLASSAVLHIDSVLQEYQPDWVLVQGDTSSAFAGGLASFYRQIRVVHLEAGLRTGDIGHPFPEEANRKMLSCLTSLHLAPTARAEENLLREGVDAETIVVTGNTVIDAVKIMATQAEQAVPSDAADKRTVLVTVHRRENHGPALASILNALRTLECEYRDSVRFVIPVHPNPNVRLPFVTELDGLPGVELTSPLRYDELVRLMAASMFVLTDSGGIQEEAPALAKPVLVLRDTTERPEGIEAGVARLVGTSTEAIVSAVSELLENEAAYLAMARAVNPYGDGLASFRAADAIERFHSVRR